MSNFDREIKTFGKVFGESKFGTRAPTINDMVDLQKLMLEEMSQTWEPAYLRFMDLKRGDKSNFPHYDKWQKEIVDRVAGWFRIIYTLRNRFQASVVSSDRLFKQDYEKCAEDQAYFINTHLWIHEPRMTSYKMTDGESMSAMLPFVMYEGQERVVREMELCYQNNIDFIIAKSREAGISWGAMAWFLHKWIFTDGFVGGIASEKQEKVDSKGSNGPLFGKLRYLLYHLPNRYRPAPYRHNKAKGTSGENNRHDTLMKIINPVNGSEIIGQTGDSIGEGYRFSVFLIDEEQNLSNPQNADRALESTTNCRGGIGTSRGMNHFGQKWASGAVHKISVMWYEDPRKVGKRCLKLEGDTYTGGTIPTDSWWRRFTEEKLKDKPEVLAQAYDMDWNASVTDLCIEPKWIQAAVDFILPAGGNDDNVAGFDVAGGGSNSSVYQQRIGNKLMHPKEIRLEEVTRNMWQAHQYAVDDRVRALQYDKQSIGESMYGLIMDSDIEIPYQLVGILGNSPASKRLVDDEGQSANDMYGNIRSEIWHKMRRLFRNTYEHTQGIRVFEADELISIPNHPKLIEQLSYPKRHAKGGRWYIESKKEMAARGLKSPDYGDAAGYCVAEISVASTTTLSHFSRSTESGHYEKIDIRPEQYGWQYTGAIFHNAMNEVSAILARWNIATQKVQFVDEYMSSSPLPKELKQMFSSKLSGSNAQKIQWLTQEDVFKDAFNGDYALHYMYQEANIDLTYNYGENQKAALITANKMFEENVATIGTDCRQLVAQLAGIEITPSKVDERFGLVNAFLLIVQNLQSQYPSAFDSKPERKKRQLYQARTTAQTTALENSLIGKANY